MMLKRDELRSVPQSVVTNARWWDNSLFLAALAALAIVASFAVLSPSFWHWFIVPVLLCGILIGSDAIDWMRGRLDLFDPIGIVGILGVHFFFLAPLLHVYRNYWMLEIATPPPDWRDWVGYMALLNVIGLLVYRWARNFFLLAQPPPTAKTFWEIEPRRFWIVFTCGLLITALAQIWIYARFGGIIGYVTTLLGPNGFEAAQGMGWLFTIADTFPTFAIIGWVVVAHKKTFARSWLVIVLVLSVFLVLRLLFGGLRGSRSLTIWGILSAVGMIHFWIRPIPRKIFLLGGVLIFVFMFGYGLYKGAGLEGVNALFDATAREQVIAKTRRDLDFVILGDLGRSDVQAFVLYRLTLPNSDYKYAWGRTYLGGIASIVPSALWRERPPTKVKEGTDALYGAGRFSPEGFHSSRQYGLAGEAMLNFGLLSVPFAFLIFGLLVGRIRQFWLTLPRYDVRWFLMPALSVFCFLVVAVDSDNLVLILLKETLIPLLILLLSVRITQLNPMT